MKKIFLSLMVTLLATAAIAQPPGAKLRKTVTTTVDTIFTDVTPSAQMMSDSAVLLKIEELSQLTIKQHKQTTERIQTLRTSTQSSNRTKEYFITSTLRSMVPIVPFIAAIFAIFFWIRYIYRRKLLRQDLIIKYIDRGEAVPEWLTRGENSTPFVAAQANASNGESNKPNSSNAKTFLVFSIVLAAWTIIWILVLVNTNQWQGIILMLVVCAAFGYACVWCFLQYLKRTE